MQTAGFLITRLIYKETSKPRRAARKPVFVVSDQVRYKPSCKTTEDGSTLAISDLGSKGSVNKGADDDDHVAAQIIAVILYIQTHMLSNSI